MLTLLLLACTPLAPPCTSDPIELYVDADGDGVGAGEPRLACPEASGFTEAGGDCDDDDADRAPGAIEAPYDDVDQDCDGIDLRDVDGDGWDLGDDCDDEDATVHPGAEEVWYDGEDSDCSGGDDYDADGDGYDSDRYGGDDCDDADAAVHPGAAETWYDGVDQDCAGDDDDDQDADGIPVETDCDDTDAATFPGAEELCDLADNNCDGAVDEGYDLDGDLSSACGGDCDDTRADIGPGIVEACNGVDDNCDGAIDEGFDGDGDAVSACAGDCDDTDPGVYPGAPETWYDGIDQDCAGDDDDDQDADGHVLADDCDDADASVYPGAPEVPYDDLDQDCDGADLRDVDGDGHEVDTDCDDTDATVHPGAAEVWYDGIDEDCLGDDDYDQDADGYALDDDCDDIDPTIHPGATDTWYDGVDSDCAGNDDHDQDADGYALDDDCDDLDPGLNPGATDVLDGIDQDCSGTADDPDVDRVALWTVLGDGGDAVGSGAVRKAEDLDGDGDAELVLSSPQVDADAGAVWLFSPGELSTATPLSDAWLTLSGAAGAQLGASVVSGSDWDGDGVAELLLGAPGDSTVYLVPPAGSSGERGASALATVTFTGTAGGALGSALAVGDIDGDGVDDLVVGAPDESSGKGMIYLFYGDTSATTVSTSSADWSAPGSDAGDALGAVLASGADQNSDGYADFLIGVPEDDEGGSGSGSAFLVEGSGLLLNLLGQPIDSVASWSTRGTSAGQALGSSVALVDVAGSGNADLLVGIPGYAWSSGTGAVAEFDGRVTGTDALSTASRLLRADGLGGAIGAGGDLDGDGSPDVVAGGADAAWLTSFAAGSSPYDLPGAELASWWGEGLGGPIDAGAGDLDGDGSPEVVFAAPEGADAVYVVPGFE